MLTLLWKLRSGPALTYNWYLLVYTYMKQNVCHCFCFSEHLPWTLRIYHTYLVLKIQVRTSSHHRLIFNRSQEFELFRSSERMFCTIRIYYTYPVLKIEVWTSSHIQLIFACIYVHDSKMSVIVSEFLHFRTSTQDLKNISYLPCSGLHQLSAMTDVCLYISAMTNVCLYISAMTDVCLYMHESKMSVS